MKLIVFFLGGIVTLSSGCAGEEKPASSNPVRQPAVSGSFYPGEPGPLKKEIDRLLDKYSEFPEKGRLLGVVSPHAGYHYSGRTAAAAFRQFQGREIRLIFLIGCAHRLGYPGVSIPKFRSYRTPLGEVEVNEEVAAVLRQKVPGAVSLPAAHRDEHSLEVELPFIQVTAPEARIVPILVGSAKKETLEELGHLIGEHLKNDQESVIVCSTDLVHYPDSTASRRIDSATLKAITTLNPSVIEKHCLKELSAGTRNLSCVMCARNAVLATVRAVKSAGAVEGVLLDSSNSSDVSPFDKSRVVGYGAVAFYGPQKDKNLPKEEKEMNDEKTLSPDSRKNLLMVARQALTEAVNGRSLPETPVEDPELQGHQGAFVTLNRSGRLRGCIGQFTAEEPLYKVVRKMAVQASLHDPRFPAVSPAELDDIDIEISVLSPMRRVSDPLEEVKVGKHGIYIRRGMRSGTYLPQVATEHNMSLEEFLTSCTAHKAGLAPDT